MREALLYALLRVVATLVAASPWSWLRVPGAVLGGLAGSVLRIRRAHVESAMARANVADPAAAARAMYASLGASLFELLWIAGRPRASVARYVRIDEASRARWQAAFERGRGVVVAASHTGNWDLAACAMASDAELLVVTKRLRARALDRFWQQTRAARGVSLCDASGALGAARQTLGRGGVVAMMIDQVPSSARHAIALPFAGASALVDKAPFVLAARTGAPIVVAVAERRGAAHVLHVLEVIAPHEGERGVRDFVADATARATRALERFVVAHPSDWLWMHRRWAPPRERVLPAASDANRTRRRATSEARALLSE